MQIIFGDHVEKVQDRFTVLELDTFCVEPSGQRLKTWCVVESVRLEEMSILEHLKKLHSDLIAQYRSRNWKFCIDAIENLQGKFNGELDSFYSNLLQRVQTYLTSPPPDDWTGDLVKTLAAAQPVVEG